MSRRDPERNVRTASPSSTFDPLRLQDLFQDPQHGRDSTRRTNCNHFVWNSLLVVLCPSLRIRPQRAALSRRAGLRSSPSTFATTSPTQGAQDHKVIEPQEVAERAAITALTRALRS